MGTKKFVIAAVIILITAMLALALFCLYAMFPKAPPISCPNPVNSWDKETNIFSIHVSHNGGEPVPVKNEEIGLVTQHIPFAKPTRIWSVNDYPAAEDYYTIEIAASTRTYWYYLYEEGSRVYIEVPYEGVYRIDRKILDVVGSYFQD